MPFEHEIVKVGVVTDIPIFFLLSAPVKSNAFRLESIFSNYVGLVGMVVQVSPYMAKHVTLALKLPLAVFIPDAFNFMRFFGHN